MCDPYTETRYCADRLLKEYRRHSRLVIAVDFDGTVFSRKETDHTHPRVWSILRECEKRGFYIVLFTAAVPERIGSMSALFQTKGVAISSVNENPIPLPYGNHGKPYYNLLLDDRSGLGQACEILEEFFCQLPSI